MTVYLRRRLVCKVALCVPLAGLVMRIELTDSRDYSGLRDYFLRLGASVSQ